MTDITNASKVAQLEEEITQLKAEIALHIKHKEEAWTAINAALDACQIDISTLDTEQGLTELHRFKLNMFRTLEPGFLNLKYGVR